MHRECVAEKESYLQSDGECEKGKVSQLSVYYSRGYSPYSQCCDEVSLVYLTRLVVQYVKYVSKTHYVKGIFLRKQRIYVA